MQSAKHSQMQPGFLTRIERGGGHGTRSAICLGLLVLFTWSQIGCLGPKRTPALARIFAEARERKGKRPIIVIPGILGSELIDEKTGEVAWPAALSSMASS